MQTWLEEIKWQQTINEEKEIAYDEGYEDGAEQASIENAKNLFKMKSRNPRANCASCISAIGTGA